MRGPPGRRGRQWRAGCGSSQVFTDAKPPAECSEVGQGRRRRWQRAVGNSCWPRSDYLSFSHDLFVTTFETISQFCCDLERFFFSRGLPRFCRPCVFVFVSRRKGGAIREGVCPFWPESLSTADKHALGSA